MKHDSVSPALRATVDASVAAAVGPRARGFSEQEGPIGELALAATAASRAVENMSVPAKDGNMIVSLEDFRVADFLVHEVMRRALAIEEAWQARQAEACQIETDALLKAMG